jgi:hypothetical protein
MVGHLYRIIVLLPIIALVGCAKYDAVRQCQKEAGGMPNQWTNAFGGVGGLANAQTPEMQAYNKSVDDCVARYDSTVNPTPH